MRHWSEKLTKSLYKIARIAIIAVGVLFAIALPTGKDQILAATGINEQINYQGKLLTAGGSAVSAGTYSIQFSLYDSAAGGNRLWTSSGSLASPSAINVSVTSEGLFSILLGSGAQNVLSNVDWNSNSIYLGVTVGSDSEMTPRKQIGSVPQAFNAQKWNGYSTASSVVSGAEVLKLVQTATDAATSDRTTLFISTSGTSDTYDYLLKARNASGDVFTISGNGNTTTTGNLSVLGKIYSNSIYASGTITGVNETLTGALTVMGLSSLDGVTFTNATGTNVTSTALYVSTLAQLPANTFVNGQSVCLANGTGCPPGTGVIPTLLQVTNAGGVSTSTSIYFYGGVTSSQLTVTGTAALNGVSFTSATGSSIQTTSGTVGLLSFTSATGGDLYALVIRGGTVTGTTVNGNAINGGTGLFGTLTSSSSTSNLFSFASATGSDLYIGTLRGQSIIFTNVSTTNSTSTNLFISNLLTSNTVTTTNLYANNSVIGQLIAASSTLASVSSTNLTFVNASGSSFIANTINTATLTANSGTIQILNFGSATGSDLFSSTLRFTTASGSAIYTNSATITTLSSSAITSASSTSNYISFNGATGSTLYVSTYVTSSAIYANSAVFGTLTLNSSLTANSSTINLLTFSSATGSDVFTTTLRFVNASGTNVTSTALFVSTIAQLPANTFINGQEVCLKNGTGCPPANSGVPTLLDVTNVGGIATSTNIYFYGGVTSSQLTVTGTTALQGVSFTSATGTSIQTTSATIQTFNFGSATGSDLFSTTGRFTTICISGSCQSSWPSGSTTSSWYGPIMWSNATGTNTTTTNLGVTGLSSLQALTFTSGTGTDFFSETGRFTAVTTTSLTVNGQTVCLKDGTNCPISAGAIPTLLQVTNAGGVSTSTSIYFYGGVTSSQLTVTGTTALQDVSFTSATGTSIQTTSSTSNYVSFNGATGSTIYATTYVTSSAVNANTLSAGTITNQWFNSASATITSATTTYLNFSSATGSTLYATTYVSSSAIYANSANITTLTGTSSTWTGGINFGSATGTTLYLSGYATSSAIYGNTGSFGTLTVNGPATVNGGFTANSSTITYLSFNGATGSTMYLSGYASSSVFYGNTGNFVTLTGTSSTASYISFNGATGSTMYLSGYVTSSAVYGNAGTFGSLCLGGVCNSAWPATATSSWYGLIMWSNATGTNTTSTNLGVTGATNLNGVNFTSATGSSIQTTSGTINYLSFNGATGSTIYAGTYVTSSNVYGNNGTFGSLTVGGQSVCLANGTGCLISSMPTLLQVTNAGGVATSTNIYFYGGVTSSQLTVTGTTALQDVSFTSATGSSIQTTSGTVGSFSFTSATGGTLYATTYVSSSQVYANSATITALTSSSSTSNYISFNGATGSTLYLSTYVTSSAIYGNTGTFGVLVVNAGMTANSSTIGLLTYASATGSDLYSIMGRFGTVTSTNVNGNNGTFGTLNAFISAILPANTTIGGTNVCLENGTGCPITGGSSDANWSWNSATGILRAVTTTNSIAVGGSGEATSPFFFKVTSTISRLMIGQSGYLADVTIGAATASMDNAAFQLTGKDLFVQGVIGSASSIYANASFVAGNGVSYGMNGIRTIDSTGVLAINATGTIVSGRLDAYGLNRWFTSPVLSASFGSLATSTITQSNLVQNGAFDGSLLWLTDFSVSGNVTVFDPRTEQVVATIPVGASTYGAAFDGSAVWVVVQGNNTVVKIDVATRQIVATVPVGTSPDSAVFDGTYLWVTNSTQSTVSKIDVRTNAVIATITVGGHPWGIAFDGTSVWTANNSDATVSKIDPTTNVVSGPYAVSGAAYLAFDGSNIWVTDQAHGSVSKLDAGSGAVVATSTVASSPLGIAFDGADIWIANNGASQITKIDARTGGTIATYASAGNPSSVIYDGVNVWGLSSTEIERFPAHGGFGASVVYNANLVPEKTGALDIGSSSKSWKDIYASGTLYVGTNVVVNGQNVCLQNGSGCQTSSIPTLLSVTNAGGVSTSTSIYFYGGVTSSQLTVTGTTALQGVSFTSATGSSIQTTSGTVGSLSFGSATGGTIYATTYVTSSAVNANTVSAGTITNQWFNSASATITSATTTYLNFSGATGSTLYVSTYVSSSQIYANNANITALTSSSSTSNYISFNGATGSTLYLSGYASSSAIYGNTGSFGTLTVNGPATVNGGFTANSSTITYLSFNGATGSTMYLSGYASSSIFYGNTGNFVTLTGTSSTASYISFNGATGSTLYLSGYVTSSAVYGNAGTFGTLTVGGQSVCLQNGTNCQGSSETLLTVTNRGGVSTSTSIYFYGGVTTSRMTVTGTSALQDVSFTSATGTSIQTTSSTSNYVSFNGATGSTMYASTYVTSSAVNANTLSAGTITNQWFNSASATITSATTTYLNFSSATGSTLYVSTYTSSSAIYANSANITTLTGTSSTWSGGINFGSATGTTLYLSGYVSSSAVYGNTGTFGTLTFTNATGTNFAWTGVASGTTLNANTISAGSLTVGGQSVCLANGTGCLISSMPTLLQVTNAGGIATSTNIYFYGGVTSSQLTVTGTTALQDVSFTSATGSSIQTTSGTVGSLSFGSATGGTIYATTYVTSSAVYANTINSATLNAVTGTFNNLTSTSGTISAFGFLSATGSDLFSSTLRFTTATGSTLYANSATITTLSSSAITSTSSTANYISFNGATGSTLYLSGYASSSAIYGNTGSFGTLTVNGPATVNGGFTANSSTITYLSFNGATGSTIYASGYVTSSVFYGNTGNFVTLTGTSSTASYISFNGATGSTLYLSGYVTSSAVYGNAGTFGTITSNGPATVNGGLTANSSTALYLSFNGATGSTLYLSGYVTSSATYANSGTFATLNVVNATTTNFAWTGVASGTTLYANTASIGSLTVGGQSVCLQNGTNCQGSSETLLTVTNRGGVSTSTSIYFYGGVTTSRMTVTGTSALQDVSFTSATGTSIQTTSSTSNYVSFNGATGSTMYASTYVTSSAVNANTLSAGTITNQWFNSASATITSATTTYLNFSSATGSTLYVSTYTSSSAIYANSANITTLTGTSSTWSGGINFGSATGTTLYLSTYVTSSAIYGNTGTFGILIVNAGMTANSSTIGLLTFTSATGTNFAWTGVASGTTLNVNTISAGSLTVGGQSVCLQNGTNCQASSETLLTVTNRGGVSTSTSIYFYGGVTSSQLTVTGTTALQDVSFTSATGSSIQTTSGTVGSLSFNSATGGTIYASTYVTSTNVNGNVGTFGTLTSNGPATVNGGLTSNSSTALYTSWNGATGSTLYVSTYTSSSQIYANSANITALTGTSSTWTGGINFGSATGTTLYLSTYVTSSAIYGNTGTFGVLVVNAGMTANSSTIGLLTFTSATGSDIYSIMGRFGTVTSTNINGNIGTFGTATIGSITAGTIAANGITVNGSNVCLQNGIGCSSSNSGASGWFTDEVNGIVYTSTSTNSVAIGGIDQSSSAFYFLVQSTSTRLLLGANGSSTDVTIGAVTSSMINSAFQLTGDDLYVNGNIGAGSIYTNGAFVAGNDTSYGIGSMTSLNAGTAFQINSSSTVVNGRLNAYGLNRWFQSPVLSLSAEGNATTTFVTGQPEQVIFDGSSIWVSTFDSYIHKINILTSQVATSVYIGDAASTAVLGYDGNSVWTGDYNTNAKKAYKVNLTSDAVTAVVTVSSTPLGAAFDGTYMWMTMYGAVGGRVLKIDPNTDAVVGNILVGSNPSGIAFDGTNMWVAYGSGSVAKINAASNEIVATVTVGTTPKDVVFDGSYIWVINNGGAGTVSKIDIHTATVVDTVTLATGLYHAAFDGQYVWVTNVSNSMIYKIDVKTDAVAWSTGAISSPSGIAFDGTSVWVASQSGTVNRLPASGGGYGGTFAVNNLSANTAALGSLLVNNTSVCLSDGTGCSSGIWGVDDVNKFIYTSSSYRLVVGNATSGEFELSVSGTIGPVLNDTFDLATASTSFRNIYASGTIYAGTAVTSSEVRANTGSISALTSNSSTATYISFNGATGSTLYASTYVSSSALYSNSANLTTITSTSSTSNYISFNGATGSTLYLSGYVTSSAVYGNTGTFGTLTFTNATGTNFAWTGVASGTTLYANTAQFGSLTVGTQSVCLANGTGCLISSMPTLLQVTNAGGVATSTSIYFYGGVTSSQLTVTGTTALQGVSFTSATGTSIQTTSSTSNYVSFNGATGSTLYVSTYTSSSAIYANSANITALTGTSSTATYISFNGATGSTLYLSGYVSSSAMYANTANFGAVNVNGNVNVTGAGSVSILDASWKNSGTETSSVIVNITTTSSAYLLLGVTANRTSGGNSEIVTSVTGGGLTWTRLAGGTQPGDSTYTSEFWGAYASTTLSNVDITTNYSNPSNVGVNIVALGGVNLSHPVGVVSGPAESGRDLSVTFYGTATGSRLFAVAFTKPYDGNTVTGGAGTTVYDQILASEHIRSTNSINGGTQTISSTGYVISDNNQYVGVEILASGGAVSAQVGAFNSLFVGTQSVCLQNGTNCAIGSMPTLLQVTNRGGVSTSTSIYFYGGVTSSQLTVTGTTALQGVSFTSATGTSIQTTSSTSNYVSFNGATGSTLYASTYVSSSQIYANSANITALTGTSSTFSGGINFGSATGSSAYIHIGSFDIINSTGTFLVVSSTSITMNGRVDAYGLNRWFQSPLDVIGIMNGTATTTVGTAPHSMAFDGAYVWVMNRDSNDISKVDPRTNTVVATVALSNQSFGGGNIAFDGTHLWASSYDHLAEIDINTNAVIASVALDWQTAAGIAFDGARMWTAFAGGWEVTAVNVQTNVRDRTNKNNAVDNNTHGMAFDGKYVWSARGDAGTVIKNDLTDGGSGIATTTVGINPYGLAFDGRYLWVANAGSDNVSKVDTITNAVIATTTVGTAPHGIAFDGKYVWVANSGSNTVSQIDVNTNSVVATYSTGVAPEGIVFDGVFIWVSNSGSGTVTKIPAIGGGYGANFLVNGQTVCLANGVGCVNGTGIPTLLQVTNAGGVATSTSIYFYGGVTSSHLVVTGTSDLQAVTFTNATGATIVTTATSSLANLLFTNNNKLGIGTSTPQARLDVNGTSNQLYLTNSATSRFTSLSKDSTDALTISNQVVQIGDLDTWIARATSELWRGIAMSADGVKQTAVIHDGYLYTSADSGASWTPRDSSRRWQDVAMSADGVKQIAITREWQGQIYVSTNSGETWTGSGDPNGDVFWQAIAMSSDGTTSTAVMGDSGTSDKLIYTSYDSGASWTPRDSNRNWFDVAMSSDGTKQTAVDDGGQIYTSTDSGVTWTPRDSNRLWHSIAMSADGTKQTAVVANGQIYTSTNSGVTWGVVASSPTVYWMNVAMSADGTKQVAVTYGGQIYTSTDSGANWTPRDSSRNWEAVAMSSDGTKQTATVDNGRIYTNTNVDTLVNAPIITSTNSLLGSEAGVLTLGYGLGRTVLNGSTLRFQIGGTEYAEISSTGKFGIGTTSPTSTLTVAGDIAPGTNNASDIGTSQYSWRNIYASGTVYAANFVATGTLTAPSSTINYLSFNGATGSTLYASTYVSSTALYANSANIATITGTSSTATYISFNGATGSTLYLSGYVSSSAIYANSATIQRLSVAAGGAVAVSEGPWGDPVNASLTNTVNITTTKASFLLAGIAADRTSGATDEQVVSVAGGGLTWSKIGGGTAPDTAVAVEYWGATSTGPLTAQDITVTMNNPANIALKIISLANVKTNSPVGVSVAPAQIADNLSVTFSGTTVGSMLFAESFAKPYDITGTVVADAGTTVYANQNNTTEHIRSTTAVSGGTQTISTTGYTTSPTVNYAGVEILPSTSSGLIVGGLNVCLSDGTNCPAATEVDTLLTVTNRGGVATSTSIYFYGGVTTSRMTVTGTSALQDVSFTSATGTSIQTTSSTSNYVSFNGATGSTLYASTYVSSSQIYANSANITALTGTSSTFSEGINFASATGTTLYVLSYVTSSAIYANTGTFGSICLSGVCNSSWPAGATSSWYGPIMWSDATGTNTTSTNLGVSGNASLTNVGFTSATGSDLFTTTMRFTTATGTTLYANQIITSSVTSTGNILLTPTGNIGIGTSTAPTYKLDVAGNFRVIIPGAGAVSVTSTGGTITSNDTYWIHTFTTSSSFVPSGDVSVDALVVGGGGAGGADPNNWWAGGGGGGGAVKELTSQSLAAQEYPVVVGDGGTPSNTEAGTSGSGEDSTFNGTTAGGGGGGGNTQAGVGGNGSNGGSGGGGAVSDGAGGTSSGGGYAGYVGSHNSGSTGNGLGGGGGGAGAAATDKNGADGISSDYSGGTVYYGGGGGGAGESVDPGYTGGTGGNGGGGTGSSFTPYLQATSGTANTGGGGGGNGNDTIGKGAAGGSGVVIIRYLKSASVPLPNINAFSVGSDGNVYVSSTAYIGTDVKVNGVSVCLQNGTNCLANGGATLLSITNGGGVATSTRIYFYGGVTTSRMTVTGTSALQGVSFTSATGTSFQTTSGTTNLFSFNGATGSTLYASTYVSSSQIYANNANVTALTGTSSTWTGGINFGSATGSSAYIHIGSFDIINSTGTFLVVTSTSITMNGRVDAYGLNRWFQSPLTNLSIGGMSATTTALDSSTGIAFDGRYMWMSEINSSKVAKFDPYTNKSAGEVSGVGTTPYGFAYDGTSMWVGSWGDNTVSQVNVSTMQVTATTAVGSSPLGMAYDGQYIWVANSGGTTVSKISTTSTNVVRTVTVGANPTGVAFDGKNIWVTNGGGTTVSIINARTTAAVRTVSVGNAPDGIAFDGSYIWVANSADSSLSKIDIRSSTVVATITGVPSTSYTAYMAYDGRYLWVPGDTQVLTKVDTQTNSIVATYGTDSDPRNTAFDGAYVWVTSFSSNNIAKYPALGGGYGSEFLAQGASFTRATSTRFAFTSATGTSIQTTSGTINYLSFNGATGSNLFASTKVVVNNASNFGTLLVGTSTNAGMYGNWTTVIASSTQAGLSSYGAGGNNAGLFVYTSSSNATTTFIYNTASSTYGGNAALDVRSGCASTSQSDIAVFGISSDWRKASISCGGGITAEGGFLTGMADYAEYFPSVEPNALHPGDVVALDDRNTRSVRLGQSEYRDATVGVISDHGAFIGNGGLQDMPNAVLVGMLGQLNVKVDARNSAIAVGDKLMMSDGGVGVKANGPGMIIGTAMDHLDKGTSGTVMTYISPVWWAGDLLMLAPDGTVHMTGVTYAASSTADVNTKFVPSPLFTFEATAYDASSSLVMASDFNLQNVPVSANASLFTLTSNATTSSLLTVSNFGDVAINGMFYPSNNGAIQYEKGIYFDGSNTAWADRMRTNASGWGANAFSFAEVFSTHEALQQGDLVVVDSADSDFVKKSTVAYDNTIVGIVVDHPGFLAGIPHATSTEYASINVALSGRAYASVSTENGTINTGDPLVASSQPGKVMKATKSGMTIGRALEAFTGTTASTTILMQVSPSWYEATSTQPASKSSGTGFAQQGFARIATGETSVHVTFASVGNYPMVSATPHNNPGNWWISDETDIGFTIRIASAQLTDVIFTWFVAPTPNGTTITNSDVGVTPVDLLTGQPIYGVPDASDTPSADTVSPPADTSTPVTDNSTPITTDTSSQPADSSPNPPPSTSDVPVSTSDGSAPTPP